MRFTETVKAGTAVIGILLSGCVPFFTEISKKKFVNTLILIYYYYYYYLILLVEILKKLIEKDPTGEISNFFQKSNRVTISRI